MTTFTPVEGGFNFGSMSMVPPPMVECSDCAAIVMEGKQSQHITFHLAIQREWLRAEQAAR